MRKTLVTGILAMAIAALPSAAWAQQLDCAATYEGQKVSVGASVQLEDGSWVTVEDANVCMGETLEHAAASAAAEGAATTSGSTSVASSAISSGATTTTSGATAGGAVPQGAANTGLGGMSDQMTWLVVSALMLGGAAAATLGGWLGRRRSV